MTLAASPTLRASDRLDPARAAAVSQQYDAELLTERQEIDASCRWPVLAFFGSAIFWLLIGTLFAMLASVKLHHPWFLAGSGPLSFGRVRPAHLNAVAYGWGAMAGLGAAVWMMCRLCRVPLRFPAMLVIAAVIWNIGMTLGITAILCGYSEGVEWVEFPAWAAFPLFASFALVGLWALITFGTRREGHVYVSQWYIFGGLFWFPWLFATVYILTLIAPVKGTPQAGINWWYGHNALGLFFSPIGVAAIYFIIPKVLGRPIYSYYLSILGFWSLALFYNWAGAHHLIGGPVPAWFITLGTIGSVMMVIPVATTALNHHMTAYKYFKVLKYSPALRFTVFGALSYTVVSLQGSMMAVRAVNEPTHFTHYTVAHAHLGLYAFYSMVMFGAMYYIVPRLTGREWASATMIKLHFWTCGLGIAAYFVLLSIGGLIQGFELNQASAPLGKLITEHGFWSGISEFFGGFKARNGAVPFMDTVKDSIPWLVSRSVSGAFMTIGHILFAILFAMNVMRIGRNRAGATLLYDDTEGYLEALGETNDSPDAPVDGPTDHHVHGHSGPSHSEIEPGRH